MGRRRIERLSQITVVDHRGGETVQESGRPEPSISVVDQPEPQEFFPNTSFASHAGEESSETRFYDWPPIFFLI